MEEIFQIIYRYWLLILAVGAVATFLLVRLTRYRSESIQRGMSRELTKSENRDEERKDYSRDLSLVTGPDGHDYIIYSDSDWEQGGICHAGGCRTCKESGSFRT